MLAAEEIVKILNSCSNIGSVKRTEFEIKAKAFAIGEVIKEERRLCSMTQEQLAEKTGTKKVLYQELKTVIATSNSLRCTNF